MTNRCTESLIELLVAAKNEDLIFKMKMTLKLKKIKQPNPKNEDDLIQKLRCPECYRLGLAYVVAAQDQAAGPTPHYYGIIHLTIVIPRAFIVTELQWRIGNAGRMSRCIFSGEGGRATLS